MKKIILVISMLISICSFSFEIYTANGVTIDKNFDYKQIEKAEKQIKEGYKNSIKFPEEVENLLVSEFFLNLEYIAYSRNDYVTVKFSAKKIDEYKLMDYFSKLAKVLPYVVSKYEEEKKEELSLELIEKMISSALLEEINRMKKSNEYVTDYIIFSFKKENGKWNIENYEKEIKNNDKLLVINNKNIDINIDEILKDIDVEKFASHIEKENLSKVSFFLDDLNDLEKKKLQNQIKKINTLNRKYLKLSIKKIFVISNKKVDIELETIRANEKSLKFKYYYSKNFDAKKIKLYNEKIDKSNLSEAEKIKKKKEFKNNEKLKAYENAIKIQEKNKKYLYETIYYSLEKENGEWNIKY